MQKHKVNRNTKFLLLMVSAFILLMLSVVNINNLNLEKKVLGADSQENIESEFWENFLSENPEYIPGWLELNQTDQAKSIDPNYQLP